ncbi:MAG: type I methionyl aminopeptidase [Thermoguttaceae bacterium]|nr:type I methionyl aminopeptidase [Thermoguttaceae bacterium]
MISLKTERDIHQMRKAGLLTWAAHELARQIIHVGMTTGELDAELDRMFTANDAIPVFKGVPGRIPYPAATCISINEQIVHGIPGNRVIQDGDIVSIDTGCKIDGWCGDSAYSHLVGDVDPESRKLVQVTRETLQLAIKLLSQAKYWSDVAREMEKYVRRNHLYVVESFVGHGIGHEMHEEPQVPNFVYREFLRMGDFQIRPGVVLAIEPMVNAGTKRVRETRDFWTIVTADGSRSAHEEHTVGMLKNGPCILTGPPTNDEEKEMAAQFFDRYRAVAGKEINGPDHP